MHEHEPVRVAAEPLDTVASSQLIRSLNEELVQLYPEAGAVHSRLDAGEVEPGRGAFLVAWLLREPVGCGAVRVLGDGDAEVKRMYVVPEHRRRGIAGLVLQELEDVALSLGVARLVLETGPRQPGAIALYRRAGFSEIPAFGEYVASPLSYCMAKRLAANGESRKL